MSVIKEELLDIRENFATLPAVPSLLATLTKSLWKI